MYSFISDIAKVSIPEGYQKPYEQNGNYGYSYYLYPGAWNYTGIKGVDEFLFEHRITINSDFQSQFNSDFEKLKTYKTNIYVGVTYDYNDEDNTNIKEFNTGDTVYFTFGIRADIPAYMNSGVLKTAVSAPRYYFGINTTYISPGWGDYQTENAETHNVCWFLPFGSMYGTFPSEGDKYPEIPGGKDTGHVQYDTFHMKYPEGSFYIQNGTDYSLNDNVTTLKYNYIPGIVFKYAATVTIENGIVSYEITGDTTEDIQDDCYPYHSGWNTIVREAWKETDEQYGFYSTDLSLTYGFYYRGLPRSDTSLFPFLRAFDNSFWIIQEDETVLEITDAGFINVYTTFSDGVNNANEAMGQLASQFWSTGLFSGNTDNHRMSAVLSIALMPQIPEYSSNAAGVHAGDELLPVGQTAGAYIFPVTSQFKQVDMGSVEINRYFHNFLDYAPFTQMQLYLPFIGIRNVNINEFMGGEISLQYIIDFLNGNINVHVHSSLHPARPLYIFTGNASVEIPLTGNTQGALIRGNLANISGALSGVLDTAEGGINGNVAQFGSGIVSTVVNMGSLNTGSYIMRSGSLSGNSGYMGTYGEYTPYVIITRPVRDETPDYYSHVRGFTSMKSATIGNLSGFTIMQGVRVNGMSATQAEKDEIEQILTTGFIA